MTSFIRGFSPTSTVIRTMGERLQAPIELAPGLVHPFGENTRAGAGARAIAGLENGLITLAKTGNGTAATEFEVIYGLTGVPTIVPSQDGGLSDGGTVELLANGTATTIVTIEVEASGFTTVSELELVEALAAAQPGDRIQDFTPDGAGDGAVLVPGLPGLPVYQRNGTFEATPPGADAGFFMTLDIMKGAAPWQDQTGAEIAKPVLRPLQDANGYPTAMPAGVTELRIDLSRVRTAGDYRITWDGTGTVETLAGGWGAALASATGELVATKLPGTPAILRIAATDPGQTGDHVRNLKIVAVGDVAAEAAGEIWHPAYLKFLATHREARFAGLMAVDQTDPAGSWSGLAADYFAGLGTYSWFDRQGMPVAALVDLCNTARVNPWFTVPHFWEDALVTQFATAVRDTLDPALVAIAEHSNETWRQDAAHQQGVWIADRASAAGWGDVDAHRGKVATLHAALWAGVFSGGDRARLVTVCAGETARVASVATQLANADWQTNEPGAYVDPLGLFDAVAIDSGYADPDLTDQAVSDAVASAFAASGTGGALAYLRAEALSGLSARVAEWQAQRNLVRGYGLRLAAYAGGQRIAREGALTPGNGLMSASEFEALVLEFANGSEGGEVAAQWARDHEAAFDGPLAHGADFFATTPTLTANDGAWTGSETGRVTRRFLPRTEAVLNHARTRPLWWSYGDPTGVLVFQPAALSTGSATIEWSADMPGTVFWALTTRAQAPSRAAIAAGTGALDFATVAVGASGAQAPIALSGLAGNTEFYLHAYHRSPRGAESPVETLAFDTIPSFVPEAVRSEGVRSGLLGLSTGDRLAIAARIRVNDAADVPLFLRRTSLSGLELVATSATDLEFRLHARRTSDGATYAGLPSVTVGTWHSFVLLVSADGGLGSGDKVAQLVLDGAVAWETATAIPGTGPLDLADSGAAPGDPGVVTLGGLGADVELEQFAWVKLGGLGGVDALSLYAALFDTAGRARDLASDGSVDLGGSQRTPDIFPNGDAAAWTAYPEWTSLGAYGLGGQIELAGNEIEIAVPDGGGEVVIAPPHPFAGTYAISAAEIADMAAGPVNEIAPTATGVLGAGNVLTATPGLWFSLEANGVPATAFQWRRGAVGTAIDIPGATGATYTQTAEDADPMLGGVVLAEIAIDTAGAREIETQALAAPDFTRHRIHFTPNPASAGNNPVLHSLTDVPNSRRGAVAFRIEHLVDAIGGDNDSGSFTLFSLRGVAGRFILSPLNFNNATIDGWQLQNQMVTGGSAMTGTGANSVQNATGTLGARSVYAVWDADGLAHSGNTLEVWIEGVLAYASTGALVTGGSGDVEITDMNIGSSRDQDTHNKGFVFDTWFWMVSGAAPDPSVMIPLFFDLSNGFAVNDLGASGAVNGITPHVYVAGDLASWRAGTNRGLASDFAVQDADKLEAL